MEYTTTIKQEYFILKQKPLIITVLIIILITFFLYVYKTYFYLEQVKNPLFISLVESYNTPLALSLSSMSPDGCREGEIVTENSYENNTLIINIKGIKYLEKQRHCNKILKVVTGVGLENHWLGRNDNRYIIINRKNFERLEYEVIGYESSTTLKLINKTNSQNNDTVTILRNDNDLHKVWGPWDPKTLEPI
ncbi:MAG: hypothetical protein R3B60_05170 [Candidatus Paceibacterota bacterium]